MRRPTRVGPGADSADPPASSPRREVLGFVGVLVAGAALFYGVSQTAFFERSLRDPSLELSARTSAGILRALGENAVSVGNVVHSPRIEIAIRDGCDALEPMALFAAAVIACPVRLGLRLVGLLVGVLSLGLLNQVRTVSLYYVGVSHPEAFEFVHLEVWQVLFIALGVATWLSWAHWTIGVERGRARHADSSSASSPASP